MPNFSFLACIEVAEKFVWIGGVELGLGSDNIFFWFFFLIVDSWVLAEVKPKVYSYANKKHSGV